MTFYGLSVYDKCLKLLELMNEKGIKEINEKDLTLLIAQNIGASKFLRTIKNYISYLLGFNMIISLGNKSYKINYECLNDK